MIQARLYFGIEPVVPRSVRLPMRRWLARRQRPEVRDIWPILPGSDRVPAGWHGWPEEKQFALVLTHDVDSPTGLANCRRLMQLEKELGFRSAFYFVPQGRYQVPSALREELVAEGFEVGVRELHPDRKRAARQREAQAELAQVKGFLQHWGAVGFRCGPRLNDPRWLQGLDIAYSVSNCDTDPFEPQTAGQHTIFPSWVPTDNGLERGPIPGDPPGYVNLPYTLAQDSTLFRILNERHPDIWFQKLDWIARQGGMALINTHPDYMEFTDSTAAGREEVWSRYAEFLDYVRRRHEGRFWHATPRHLAEWYRQAGHAQDSRRISGEQEARPLAGKRAAVVLYSYYPLDQRPRLEAEALVKAGMEVELICLREKPSEPAWETIAGVRVRRVPMNQRRGGKFTYLARYGAFIAFCTAALAYRSIRRRYELVHVHNMPDVLVFSALAPKLRGARVILDQHDPMPELMMTIFGLAETSLAVRALKWFERASLRFADSVVTVNAACKRLFASRSCPADKVEVVMNAPDEEIFERTACQNARPAPKRDAFVIMYHGSIVERHGLDLAVEALQLVRQNIPGVVLRIYGSSTPFLDKVLRDVEGRGLRDAVSYLGPKDLPEIAQAIRDADVGIIPNRQSFFTQINTPTRIFEFLSLGKPVIAPVAPGITDYFGQNDLVYFRLGDAQDLARKLAYVHANHGELQAVVERGRAVYQRHRWSDERERFVDGVARLLKAA